MSDLDYNQDFSIVNSKYTPIQIWVALDTWNAARAELDAAINASAWNIQWDERTDAENDIAWQIQAITDKCHGRCPINTDRRNIRRHSSERYPVDTALRSAATLRNAAKKVRALTALAASKSPEPATEEPSIADADIIRADTLEKIKRDGSSAINQDYLTNYGIPELLKAGLIERVGVYLGPRGEVMLEFAPVLAAPKVEPMTSKVDPVLTSAIENAESHTLYEIARGFVLSHIDGDELISLFFDELKRRGSKGAK